MIDSCSLLNKSEQKVKKILQELSIEKSPGFDTIPPKLFKLAANYSAGTLLQSINNSIKKGYFPKIERFHQLLPSMRKLMTKTCIKFLSNKYYKFLLKSLRKHTENILKIQLAEKMNNLFSLLYLLIENLTIRSM